MADINPTISVITLNTSDLNAQLEDRDCRNGSKKKDPTICCLQEIYFKEKDKYKVKVNGWRKIYHANATRKKKKSRNSCVRQNTLQSKESYQR